MGKFAYLMVSPPKKGTETAYWVQTIGENSLVNCDLRKSVCERSLALVSFLLKYSKTFDTSGYMEGLKKSGMQLKHHGFFHYLTYSLNA